MRTESSLNRAIFLAALPLALLAGCASYDGRGLVPGKSAAGDVEALMGEPREKMPLAGGDTVWFYPKGPEGRYTYAVRLGADGVLRGIDQRLTVANLARLAPGSTTAKEVREIFGPPNTVVRMERQERDVWEYRMYNNVMIAHNLYVQFSYDGVFRESLFLRDPSLDSPAGSFP